jgi:hypothetical protein
MPIPRLEIERVAWFLGLLTMVARAGGAQARAETGLMAYWGDEVTRANAFWQSFMAGVKKAAG